MDRNKRNEFDNCLRHASLINKFCFHLTLVTRTSPNHYTVACYGSMTPEVVAPFVNDDSSSGGHQVRPN